MLEKGTHRVDFKALGVVELQLKALKDDDVAKAKIINPVLLPRHRLEKEVGSGVSARNIEEPVNILEMAMIILTRNVMVLLYKV